MFPQNFSDKSESKFFPAVYKIVGFLLGARIFMTILLTFALYVSTFFLFNQMESLRAFVFDFKVHGIIFCTVLTVSAGGIINQFYDREKDRITRPFRTRIQSFFRQKYFLYSYIVLNSISLTIAFIISPRVLLFFLFYQFFMWFYSHKLTKLLIINNLSFVFLAIYPFLGMLVYYKTFSIKVFFMAAFLFLIVLIMDIIKDQLTKSADLLLNYNTTATSFSGTTNVLILVTLFFLNAVVCINLTDIIGISTIMGFYFLCSIFLFSTILVLKFLNKKNADFLSLNLLRIWIFLGAVSMMADGIITKY